MSENISRPTFAERLSRRTIAKRTAGLGMAAVGGALYGPAQDLYRKIGDDYGNDEFWKSVEAIPTDRAKLNKLLSDHEEQQLPVRIATKDQQANPEAFAEFLFAVDKPGLIHAEFNGLIGSADSGTSLTVLKASVNDGEEFLIPIIRDPHDQSPVSVQFGTHEAGLVQRLSVSVVEDSGVPLKQEEITPAMTRGATDSLRGFIDAHQPDMYPFNYNSLAHNIPFRSLAFVHETPEGIALVYWQECIDEDKEFGRWGTSVQQLYATKRRPTDNDWILELEGDPETGIIRTANIAEPWHNRQPISPSNAPRIPLRIASRNNNVKLVTEKHILSQPKIRFRPEIWASNERWEALYNTAPAAARLSVCENIRKGNIDPSDPFDALIIQEVGLDVDACYTLWQGRP